MRTRWHAASSAARTAALLVTLFSAGTRAQTTLGSILGVATDPSGAAVPGVAIVVENTGTGIQHQRLTDAAGLYEVPNIIPGRYAVTAEHPGFKTMRVTDVLLQTSAAVRVDLRLEVGEVTTSVEVQGQAAPINTEGVDVSAIRSQDVTVRLPLNARGQFNGFYYDLLVFTPGAVRGQGSNFSFAGSRGFQWGATVDGTSQRSPLFANSIGPASSNMEATAEIRIQLANDKAEASLPGGFYASSKSGSNQHHGSLFWYHSNSRLTARNTFSPTVPFRVENNYGGSIGGPIVRNRTFFFATYERFPLRTQAVFNNNVPTAAFRQGDFSSLLPGTLVRDPLTGMPFPGNQIPQGRLSQSSLGIQDEFFLLPNAGAPDDFQQNWQGVRPGSQYKTQIETRIDHQLTAANSLFARVSWNRAGSNTFSGMPTLGRSEQDRRTTTVTISDNHVFSPRLINEFRFGIMRTKNPFWRRIDGPELIERFGLQGISWNPELDRGAPSFGFNNFAGISPSFQDPSERIHQVVNNLTWTRGKHTVKTGVDFRWNRGTNFPGGTSFPVEQFGSFSFTGVFSGFDYADFLLGLPQTASRGNAAPLIHSINTDFAWFVQDDWKVTNRLTLNLGIRYEYNPPYHEKENNFFNFLPDLGAVVVPDQAAAGRVHPLFPRNLAPVVTAAEAGLPESLFYTDLNNFVPRFGFAYRPFNTSRTVLRGGYGVYIDDLTSSIWRAGTGGPFISSETFTNTITGGVPDFQFPRAFPAGFGAIGAQSFTAIDPNLRSPYIQQWSLTLEQELLGMGLRVSYIGTNSRKLTYRPNINQPPPGLQPFNNSLRRFPALRDVRYVQSAGMHNYNSLHVVAERKLQSGLYYQLGWTWAKNLTDAQSDSESGSAPENAWDRRREYSNVNYTPRHRVTGSLIYDLPFGSGRRYRLGGVTDWILGGWTISSLFAAQTGSFFNATFSGFDVSNTNTTGGRPDRLADGNLPESQRSIEGWFDPRAFVVPGDMTADGRPDVPVGRFGNSAPNILVGPGTFDLSGGLLKHFQITEGVRAVLQGTFRNVLNHPNYGLPATNIRAANVGAIRSMNGLAGPRVGQLALRIEF
jgi:hypothetical protein